MLTALIHREGGGGGGGEGGGGLGKINHRIMNLFGNVIPEFPPEKKSRVVI